MTDRDRALMAGTRDQMLNDALERAGYLETVYAALNRDYEHLISVWHETEAAASYWQRCHNSCRLALWFAAAIAGIEFLVLVGLWG
jgi:hypothetical protein